jgi:hypothetical protein
MKIEKTEPACTFQPILISITIESEEEWNVIYNMTSFDQSIPGMFGPDGSKEYSVVERFLLGVRKALK